MMALLAVIDKVGASNKDKSVNQVKKSSHDINIEILSKHFASFQKFDHPLQNCGLMAYTFFDSDNKTALYYLSTIFTEKGGTFTIQNLKYLYDFLDYIDVQGNNAPFIFNLHSGGVRITESRTIFDSIWGVLPKLFSLRKKRLYISIANEMCLGAAGIFFSQAHLRLANGKETLINLTGPGVINSFFGQSENYYEYASAQYQIEKHNLIHEIFNCYEDIFNKVRKILYFSNSDFSLIENNSIFESASFDIGEIPEGLIDFKDTDLKLFLKDYCDEYVEIISAQSLSGRAYICRINGYRYGLLANIPGRNNLIDVKQIEKYTDCLKIFRALQLPIVVVTDTPGGDPRKNNSDKNIILKTVDLVELMTEYPFKKIGIIHGRCFGGSGLVSMSHANKSDGFFAIKGSRIGIMSDEIIAKMISGHSKALEEWKKNTSDYKENFEDYVKIKTIDHVVEKNKIKDLIINTLFSVE